MNVAGLRSFLKQNGHDFMSMSGIFCLILSIWLIKSFNNMHELRYTEIMQNLTEVNKSVMSHVPMSMEKFVGLEDTLFVNERVRRADKEDDEEDIEEVDEDEKGGKKGSRRKVNEGAVYIRWGRKTCPIGTEMVYTGIAAGSWHGHHGAATNHQCLPIIPVWGNHTNVAGGAFIYGMEYEEAFSHILGMTNVKGKTLLNQNVPCAVCHSKKRTSLLMVPGGMKCYPGWRLEYKGYLTAGNHGSAAGTSYICVDDEPEVAVAGYRNEDGALLYRVTGACGTLPCPKYVKNRELTCAVCTK